MVHGEEWTTATAPPHRRPQGQSVPTGRPPGLSLHSLLHVPLARTDPVHTHQQCELILLIYCLLLSYILN